MNDFLVLLLSLFIASLINYFTIYFANKKVIKDNIDLFIEKHEQQVIHEVNNELFKKDKEVLNVK